MTCDHCGGAFLVDRGRGLEVCGPCLGLDPGAAPRRADLAARYAVELRRARQDLARLVAELARLRAEAAGLAAALGESVAMNVHLLGRDQP